MAARLGSYPLAVIAPPPKGVEDARLSTGFGGVAIHGNVGRLVLSDRRVFGLLAMTVSPTPGAVRSEQGSLGDRRPEPVLISITFMPKASLFLRNGSHAFQSVSICTKNVPRIGIYQRVTGKNGPEKMSRSADRRKPRRGRHPTPSGGGSAFGGLRRTGNWHFGTPSIFPSSLGG